MLILSKKIFFNNFNPLNLDLYIRTDLKVFVIQGVIISLCSLMLSFYYLQGFGKRIVTERSQHISSSITRNSTSPNLKSTYQLSYNGKKSEPCQFKRFPRIYPAPGTGQTTLSTKWWEPKDDSKTKLHVLAITQEPHSKPNQWRYSYQPSIFSWIATTTPCKTKENFLKYLSFSKCCQYLLLNSFKVLP